MIISKSTQEIIDCSNRQVERIDLKLEKGGPTETIANKVGLRDCLSVRNSLTYGNGAFILGTLTIPKGGRKHTLNSISQYNGFRYYSTGIKTTIINNSFIPNGGQTDSQGQGDLPKRFKKLIELCEHKTKDMKFNDVYKLMFNQRMYEVAYNKLKSNPGNMTVGINPTTLDGLSVE